MKSLAERIESLKLYAPGDEAEELFRATCSLCYQMNGIGDPDHAETLYQWAKEQAEESYTWVKENYPERLDDFVYGKYDY